MGSERFMFGTDGIRDVANRGSMTPEMALRIGRAFILFLAEQGGAPRPRIVMGRDTRRSGVMLECALAAGMASAGAEVLSAGIIPTPGVSYAVTHLAADGGIVVSASHNPAEYNGIKLLDKNGCKLSDSAESAIEDYLEDNITDDWRPTGASVGEVRDMPHLIQHYVEALSLHVAKHPKGVSFPFPLAFDCAHGAAVSVLPLMIERLGVECAVLGAHPDGLNINEGVGVMDIQHLSQYVTSNKCALGFAFDGDADRVLVVDAKGRVLDGDIMLWVLARWLASQNMLGSGVVATVMSNLALEQHLNEEGIAVYRCPVGDRYVLHAMRTHCARLGGEQSGHVIADEFTRTGDGLCTALLFLMAINDLGEDTNTLIERFAGYPQKLANVSLRSHYRLQADYIANISEEATLMLGSEGRVLIRPSGTEPLLRILVEAKEPSLRDKVADFLIKSIEKHS